MTWIKCKGSRDFIQWTVWKMRRFDTTQLRHRFLVAKKVIRLRESENSEGSFNTKGKESQIGKWISDNKEGNFSDANAWGCAWWRNNEATEIHTDPALDKDDGWNGFISNYKSRLLFEKRLLRYCWFANPAIRISQIINKRGRWQPCGLVCI